MNQRIVFCTTCRGRAQHIKQTLPRNLAENSSPFSKFVLLDYNSQDDLVPYLRANCADAIKSGKLIIYSCPYPTSFHVAHAKNMAARLGILEGADILVTLDADNFTGQGFENFVADKFREPGIFLCPDFPLIHSLPWGEGSTRPLRGFAGRLAVRSQDFIKAGGYNEIYETWRGEDIDFNARMGRMGYTMRHIDNAYLGTIPHSAEVRFKEYPHARQYESVGGWKIQGNETGTVINYGRFGTGKVFRNFDLAKPIILNPVPTRIFGIGMHKTATNSLHKAFQILGFDSLHWGTGEAPLIWQEMQSQGKSKTLERYYSLCDLPIPLLYKQLDHAYPGSKFILTLRDEKKWLKSVEGLWNEKLNPTRWMWDVYPFSHRIHKALYGRTDFDAETMLNRYRQHNREVIDYFRDREDLLVVNMEEKEQWPGLCSFLNQPIPSIPYPREYATTEIRKGDTQCWT
jgi:hypothetical protein